LPDSPEQLLTPPARLLLVFAEQAVENHLT
jgi:hypothetical protein